MDTIRTVLHWYDFLCPFCYVAQHRNGILVRHGLDVVELPLQAHPDIPLGGISAGPRKGPMYAMLEREAQEAGLPLRWPPHLPNTRLALAAAEWAREHQSRIFSQFHKELFRAHFVLGEDLEDKSVIDSHADEVGIDLVDLQTALADGSAAQSVADAESRGRTHGVQGTPAWLFDHQLISGRRPNLNALPNLRLAAESAAARRLDVVPARHNTNAFRSSRRCRPERRRSTASLVEEQNNE